MTAQKIRESYSDDVRLALLEKSLDDINVNFVRFEKRFDKIDDEFTAIRNEFREEFKYFRGDVVKEFKDIRKDMKEDFKYILYSFLGLLISGIVIPVVLHRYGWI